VCARVWGGGRERIRYFLYDILCLRVYTHTRTHTYTHMHTRTHTRYFLYDILCLRVYILSLFVRVYILRVDGVYHIESIVFSPRIYTLSICHSLSHTYTLSVYDILCLCVYILSLFVIVSLTHTHSLYMMYSVSVYMSYSLSNTHTLSI